jgi:hypothetical protein
LAHALLQSLGKCFREPIRECLDHDGRVVVIGLLETLRHVVFADPGGHHEGADVVGQTAGARSDKIGQRHVGATFAPGELMLATPSFVDNALC